MSDMRTLIASFSTRELNSLLTEAVYKECIFNKPDLVAKAVSGFDGGTDAEKVQNFINAEKTRLVVEYAESVGAQVGVLTPTDFETAGSC